MSAYTRSTAYSSSSVEDRIAFSKAEGYQTENSPIATTLFEEFAEENFLDVEVAEIESASESGFESASTTRSPD